MIKGHVSSMKHSYTSFEQQASLTVYVHEITLSFIYLVKHFDLICNWSNTGSDFFSDGKTIMYEKSFLKDVAYQNFAKYEVQYRLKTPVIVSLFDVLILKITEWDGGLDVYCLVTYDLMF